MCVLGVLWFPAYQILQNPLWIRCLCGRKGDIDRFLRRVTCPVVAGRVIIMFDLVALSSEA